MEGRDGGQYNRASGIWRGVPWRSVKEEAQAQGCLSAAAGAHTVARGLEGGNLETSNSWGGSAAARPSAQKVYLEKRGSTASIREPA